MLLTVNRDAQRNRRPSNGLIIGFAYVPIKMSYAKKKCMQKKTASMCFPFHRSNSDECAVALRRILLQAMTCYRERRNFAFVFSFIFCSLLILFSTAKGNFSIEIECTVDAHDLQKFTSERRLHFAELRFTAAECHRNFSWKHRVARACARVTHNYSHTFLCALDATRRRLKRYNLIGCNEF